MTTVNINYGGNRLSYSTIEATYFIDQSSFSSMAGGKRWSGTHRSQAIPIYIDDGEYIFVLFNMNDKDRSASRANWMEVTIKNLPEFFPRRVLESGEKGLNQLRKLNVIKPKFEVPIDSIPMLVGFHDIRDPNSVFKIDPDNIYGKNGKEIKIESVVIEVVSSGIWPFNKKNGQSEWLYGENIPSSIESILPWFSSVHGRALSGAPGREPFGVSLSSRIGSSNFLVP